MRRVAAWSVAVALGSLLWSSPAPADTTRDEWVALCERQSPPSQRASCACEIDFGLRELTPREAELVLAVTRLRDTGATPPQAIERIRQDLGATDAEIQALGPRLQDLGQRSVAACRRGN